jgi:hypothetical protein
MAPPLRNNSKQEDRLWRRQSEVMMELSKAKQRNGKQKEEARTAPLPSQFGRTILALGELAFL